MVRVLIVDDHPMVTEGISGRLRAQGHEVAAAHTLATAQAQLAAACFDLLVLDLDLGGEFGTDLLRDGSIATRLPSRITILSGTSDRDEIAIALDHGAHAFVAKSLPFEDVVRAIESTLTLPDSDDPFLWDENVGGFVTMAALFPKGTLLAPQERKVFALMRQGLSDKQIAAALDRSIHTVRVQIRSILRKRGSRRRGETV